MAAAAFEPNSLDPKQSSTWIAGPGWDLFWMFAALWASLLLVGGGVALGLTAYDGFAVGFEVFALAFMSSRVLGLLHSWSTTHVVLFSKLFAPIRQADRITYTLIPLVIVVGSLALGLATSALQLTGGNPRDLYGNWLLPLYFALFWVGHFWHFGNQDFGVLTIYRNRAGQNDLRSRQLDRRYASFMMFLIQPIAVFVLFKKMFLTELALDQLALRQVTLWSLAMGFMIAATAGTLFMVGRELRSEKRSLPKLLYYLVMWSHPAFLFLAANWRPEFGFLYTVVYIWSHNFIAIGLVAKINAGAIERKERVTPRMAWLRHALALGGIGAAVYLLTGSYVKFSIFQRTYTEVRRLFTQVDETTVWIAGLLLGFFLGEQLLHYYCDRRLFRFRDPEIRRHVAPLILR